VNLALGNTAGGNFFDHTINFSLPAFAKTLITNVVDNSVDENTPMATFTGTNALTREHCPHIVRKSQGIAKGAWVHSVLERRSYNEYPSSLNS